MNLRSPFTAPLATCGLFLVVCLVCGCGGNEVDFVEVKRLDEPLDAAELGQLLRVAKAFPDQKIPETLVPYSPAPDWPASRTLPVHDLLLEERHAIEQQSSTAHLAKQLLHYPEVQRALQRERMTAEQFVGLVAAFGVATSRTYLDDHQDLQVSIERGENILRSLSQDMRPFSSLNEESQYNVLQKATWATRLNRARQLQQVPEENLEFVTEHADALAKVLPIAFQQNPFTGLIDRLDEYGVPFTEKPSTGFDADLTWSKDEAIIGREVVSRAVGNL